MKLSNPSMISLWNLVFAFILPSLLLVLLRITTSSEDWPLPEFLHFSVVAFSLWVLCWYTVETHLYRKVTQSILIMQKDQFTFQFRPWIYFKEIRYDMNDTLQLVIFNGGSIPAECLLTVTSFELLSNGQRLAHFSKPVELSKYMVMPNAHIGGDFVSTALKLDQMTSAILKSSPELLITIRLDYGIRSPIDDKYPFGFIGTYRIPRFDSTLELQKGDVTRWEILDPSLRV